MKRLFWVILVFAASVALCSYAMTTTTDYSPVPLPQVPQTITSSSSSLPPEIMAFCGKWAGRWKLLGRDMYEIGTEMTIDIEEINFQEATVFYSWKASRANTSPGSVKIKALFSRDKKGIATLSWTTDATLSWTTGAKKEFTFRLNKDDELEGTVILTRLTRFDYFIIMKRMK